MIITGRKKDNDWIVTSKITVDNYPEVEYEDFNIPRWDWKGFLSKFYRKRNIEITWYLKSDTSANLQLLVDEFKKKMSQTTWLFKYLVDWEYRVINATTTALNIPKEHYSITLVPFSLTLSTLYYFLI